MLFGPEGGGFAAPARPGGELTSSTARGTRAVARGAYRATSSRSSRSSRSERRAEFERYYRAAYPGLVALQHALCGDRDRGAASAREAFVRAWLNWKAVRGLADRDAWVRRAARQARTPAWLPGRSPGRPPAAAPGPRLSANNLDLLRALDQLPGVQRRAVVLRYMARLSGDQIAGEESTSVEVIDARIAHGRLALALRLGLTPADLAGAHPGRESALDDWAAREFAYLAYGLTPTSDLPPAGAVVRLATRWRRTTVGVAAAVLVVGSVAVTVGHTMSNGTYESVVDPIAGARGGPAPDPTDPGTQPGRPVPGELPNPGAGRPTGHHGQGQPSR